MAHETIFGAVDQSMEELCKEFRSRPTLFYTEHDIVSFFTPSYDARSRSG